MSHSDLFPALEGIFGSRAAAAALMHLQEFGESHPKQIAQRFGCTTGRIQKQLDKFEELGLIESRVRGQVRLYDFVQGSPVSEQLRSFLGALGAVETTSSKLGPLFDQAGGTEQKPSTQNTGKTGSRRVSYIHEMDLGFINMLTPKQSLDRCIDVLHDLFVLLREEPSQSSILEPMIQNLLQATLVFAEHEGPTKPEWAERLGQDLYLSIVSDVSVRDLDYWRDTPFWSYFRCRFHVRAALGDLPALREICEDLLKQARKMAKGKLPEGSRVWKIGAAAQMWHH